MSRENPTRESDFFPVKPLLAIVPAIRALNNLVSGLRSLASAYPMYSGEQLHAERSFEAVNELRDSIESSSCIWVGCNVGGGPFGRARKKFYGPLRIVFGIPVAGNKVSFDEAQHVPQILSVRAVCSLLIGRINDADSAGQTTQPGMTLTAGDIGRICGDLGADLARKGIRITSGCAPFVGKPAVEAAFVENPSLARFYLRKNGGRAFKSTAPAIVVERDDYACMRSRFIPELSTMIAVGGGTDATGKSGTLEEIDMAMGRGIPVVFLSPAGGEVGAQYQQLRARVDKVYKDDRLAREVGELNDAVASKPAAELRDFARDKLPAAIERLLSVLMGASAALPQERQGRDW